MKRIFLLFVLAATTNSVAQITFENGYFIDNNQKRTECLIRNIQWNDTPAAFEYKLSENAPIATKKDSEVSEFGFGTTKYISAEVDMDFSSDRIEKLSLQKNPEFSTVRIFMKLITDGNVKLYHYGKNDLQRYFYSAGNGKIQQLVYKRYYSDPKKENIVKNYLFRQQLWTDVKCHNITMPEVEKLSYNKSDLAGYFEKVNECNGSAVKTARIKPEGSVNLKAAVMFGQQRLVVETNIGDYDFGSKTYISFGAEFEWIVPFWNNKWGIIAEPSYNSYESSKQDADSKYSTSLKYVRIAAGFRHYFFLNDHSKIFLNGALNFNKLSASSHVNLIEGDNQYPTLDFEYSSITAAIGVGYNFKKFNVELRYYPKSNPSPYNITSYSYNKSEIIFRYQFL